VDYFFSDRKSKNDQCADDVHLLSSVTFNRIFPPFSKLHLLLKHFAGLNIPEIARGLSFETEENYSQKYL